MLGRLILPAAVAALAVPASAEAAKPVEYKVVKAAHTSSSVKQAEGYAGGSSATWRLAKAPSKLVLRSFGGPPTGQVQFQARGSYGVDITTNRPGRCAWTASTGDRERPMVAPDSVALTVSGDPSSRKRLRVSFTAIQASLANPYLGTECSTDASGEPDAETTALKTVKAKVLKRKKVKIRFKGRTVEDGITYTWSTVFELKRLR